MKNIERDFTLTKQWFDSISEAKGNQKLDVIRECEKQCSIAWALLLIYLNPYNVLHIGIKSIESSVDTEGTPYDEVNDMIKDLVSVASINNKMIAKIKQTLNSIEDDAVRKFAIQYITKTAKIGVTANTVNKAVEWSAIPTFGCMLANKYFDHTKAIVGKTIAVTEKLDGIRALAIVHIKKDGIGLNIYSRQGKPITGLCEIEKAIKDSIKPFVDAGSITKSIVLDGELLITDRKNIPSKEQYKLTTKIVNAETNQNKTGITYNIFDALSYEEFSSEESQMRYTARRIVLETIFEENKSDAIRVVPVKIMFKCKDEKSGFDLITSMVTEARNKGEEGIMLNVCDAYYVCKRTNNLLKVKVFQDCDLKIIGFQAGTGKFENTLGALIVEYKGNPVGVGSGISDEQRNEFWNNQDLYLGRVVTVQYFEETNDADGKKSIRFPVFKELREEGKEISYN